MTHDAKTESRQYFNKHNRSKLAGAGYWNRDYKYALAVIDRIWPENLIDIGCGPGAFLLAVENRFPKMHKAGLDLSEEMIKTAK